MGTSLIYQIQQKMAATRAQIETHLAEIEARQNEQNRITEKVEDDGRSDLNVQESARFRELSDQVAQLDRELNHEADDPAADDAGLRQILTHLEERHAELVKNAEIQERNKQVRAEWGQRDTTSGAPQVSARVKAEARTYNPDNPGFFRDLYESFRNGDPQARARLDRHQQEARFHEAAGYEKRDGTTSNYAGLTVPQYLTDLVAPAVQAMRPTVDICRRHPLPGDGLTVNISRITTSSSVGAQSAEGDAVSETDVDDTLLTVNVRTYSGQQDLSRQALERSTGVETVVLEDLVRSYWTTLDSAVINGDGSAGTHTGIGNTGSIQTVTYTDGTPTAAELYPKLANLISDVQAGVYMGVTHFIMHPRRWWWLASQVGSTFPFLTVPQAGTQQAGNIGGTEYMAMNRNILGVPVVVDGNVTTSNGTNEDIIYGVTAPELHLWHDDGPLFIRAEQPGAGTLEVKFVVYSYSAFTAGRYPGAHGTVSGTGLTAPTF